MKANELMIGDWVFVHKPTCKGHRVDYINEMDEEIGADGEIYNVCDIEPIPLTPEILEKNGFVYKKLKGVGGNEIWRIEDDYYDIDIYEWSDSIWIFRYDCTEMSLPHTQVTMSYVHELQHVFRLCGIEKEIKL